MSKNWHRKVNICGVLLSWDSTNIDIRKGLLLLLHVGWGRGVLQSEGWDCD